VLRGTANGEVMLERVMSDEQVPIGETVLTSGGDQIFPKGLPIGTVAQVSNGKDLFLNVKIKPAANLSKLEEVLVLVEKQERQATAEEGVHVRAADILAQRLPSVPDKPAADANSGTGAAKPAAPNTIVKPAAKNPAGSGNATSAPAGGPAAKTTQMSTQPSGPPKTTGATGSAASAPKSAAQAGAQSGLRPGASQTVPASATPNPASPPEPTTSTAPPANSKPPADESSPQ
jgi:rod shape-determining protein MreC